MPCCGLIAFLLGQPLLLWNAFRSWLVGGVPFRKAFHFGAPLSLKLAGAAVAAELVLFSIGAGVALQTRQIDSQITQAAILPLGKICSIFTQGNN